MRTPSTLSTDTVLAAAQLLCEPGSRKVWVADLYQVAAPAEMALDTFKAWLVDQHIAGALELSRADVARVAEAAIAAESECRHLNATWHRLIVR